MTFTQIICHHFAAWNKLCLKNIIEILKYKRRRVFFFFLVIQIFSPVLWIMTWWIERHAKWNTVKTRGGKNIFHVWNRMKKKTKNTDIQTLCLPRVKPRIYFFPEMFSFCCCLCGKQGFGVRFKKKKKNCFPTLFHTWTFLFPPETWLHTLKK